MDTFPNNNDHVILASNNPKKNSGRKKFQETRHPIYRGVRRRDSRKWVCEVRVPNKKSRIWLGTFHLAEMAARAHDMVAIALRGRSTCLNFADSAWRLPVPASTNAKDTRKMAAEAAESFPPHTSELGGEGTEMAAKATVGLSENLYFMDDEDMYGVWANMAEGLMMPPPPQYGDDVDMDADVSLWSYSM